MGSTYERSFVKGLIWEGISFLIVILIAYFYYGNFSTSLLFSLVLTLIKIPLFFVSERIWKQIKWGKIPEKRR